MYVHHISMIFDIFRKKTPADQVRSMGARLHGYYPEISTTLAVPRCGAAFCGGELGKTMAALGNMADIYDLYRCL